MLTIHILAVIFSVVVIFFADKEALAWIRGKKKRLDPKRVALYHWLTWIGLLALIVSGVFLAYPMLGFLIRQPLFIIKMLFVTVLFVNAILIGKLQHHALNRTFAELSTTDKHRLITSGAISSFSWIAAIILAFVVFQ